jgi:hypothetical protein
MKWSSRRGGIDRHQVRALDALQGAFFRVPPPGLYVKILHSI